MATCSFAGFLFGPRVLRSAAIIAVTPPPGVTTALRQSTLAFREAVTLDFDFAAAIWDGLKAEEVVVGFFTVGIAARDEMRGVITARGPDQKDNPAAPHAQALQPEFTIALAIIFHRDHRVVENRFKRSQINLVLADVTASLRLVPRDHVQTVYAV